MDVVVTFLPRPSVPYGTDGLASGAVALPRGEAATTLDRLQRHSQTGRPVRSQQARRWAPSSQTDGKLEG
jgi:hypothetical protein